MTHLKSIGMEIPQLSNTNDQTKFESITMRYLRNIIGMDQPVSVIDVCHQNKMDVWMDHGRPCRIF